MNIHRVIRVALTLTFTLLSSTPCWADSWEQTLSAELSTEYDTNPIMAPDNPTGVWRGLITPTYSLLGIIGNSEVTTGLAVQMASSSNETLSPNRNSPTIYLDWLQPSELGEFGISTKYAEISSRDSGLDTTGVIAVESARTSRAISGKWRKSLSERSTLSANGSYENISYESGAFVNYAMRTVNMMYTYQWSENSIPFISASHSEYEPTSGISLSSFTNTFLVGINWKASDTLEGSLSLGKSKVSDAETGTQGGGSVQYSGQRMRLLLSANHQILPSGLGGFATTDQAKVSWSYELNTDSKTGIDSDWQKNHLTADIIAGSSSIWFQEELDASWLFRTYYMYKSLNREGFNSAYANILGISFTYTRPDF